MKKLFLCLVTLAACGGPSDPGVTLDEPGPMTVGSVGSISLFTSTLVSSYTLHPVAAVGPEERMHVGWVEGRGHWPTITADALPEARFTSPSRFSSNDLAIVASRDGYLHAVWDAGSSIFYARIDPDTYTGDTIQVASDADGQPNLALAPDGRVVITYRKLWRKITRVEWERPAIMVVEGRADSGFGRPMRVGPSFTDAVPEGDGYLSGASIAIAADGSMHLAYQWTTGALDGDHVEYVSDNGRCIFGSPILLNDPAPVASPLIAAGPSGVQIVYLSTDGLRQASLSPSRELQTSTLLERSVQSVAMAQDADGDLHLAAEVADDEGTKLLYLRPSWRADRMVIAEGTATKSFHATSRAGGFVVTPEGELLISYTEGWSLGAEEPGNSMVARGVPRE